MGLDYGAMGGPVSITDTGFAVSYDKYSSNVNQDHISYFCLILK